MDRPTITSLTPDTLTWDTAYRLFALRNRAQSLSVATQQLYSIQLELFRRWLDKNGTPSPSEILPQTLRAHLEARRAEGVRPATVDCVYRILKTFWRFLERDGLILTNPMSKVERPRREKRFIQPITDAQLRQILEQIDNKKILGVRDYALILFLADTGLRISEALSLKVSDVDWTACTVLVMGKGRKERRVAFGQTARRAVLTWIRKRRAESDELLWVNRYGEPLTRQHFNHRMKTYTQKAGIAADRLSPHALRHFFALSFLRNGGDVMTLQKLLGHASLDMVRNYVNMTDDDALAKHRQASPLDKMGPLPNERKRVRLR